jgi:sugar porter (SP) family MFS transporter
VAYRQNFALYCAVVVSIGGFVFGFDASVISGVVGFVTSEFDLSPIEAGFVVAAPTASGLLGTVIAGPLSDHFGRRKVLMVIAAIYLLSAIASALATSYLMLVGARALGGIAFTSLMLAPLYIGEISPAAVRGKRVSINQLNIVLGLSAAYFTNYFILQLSESGLDWVVSWGIADHAWRWMLGLEIVPAGVFFLMLFTLPDTPRWLMLKGRTADAERVIARLLPPDQVTAELAVIRDSSASEPESVWSRIGDIFKPSMRLALVVGLVVAVAQQITGINAIFFYAPTIFEQSGIGTNAAFSQAVMVGLTNVIFTVVAMALIDRWGRKPLLVLGLSGIIVSMGICSWGFASATYSLTPQKIDSLRATETLDTRALSAMSQTNYDSDIAFKAALNEALGERAARGSRERVAAECNPNEPGADPDWHPRFRRVVCHQSGPGNVGTVFRNFPQPAPRCSGVFRRVDQQPRQFLGTVGVPGRTRHTGRGSHLFQLRAVRADRIGAHHQVITGNQRAITRGARGNFHNPPQPLSAASRCGRPTADIKFGRHSAHAG